MRPSSWAVNEARDCWAIDLRHGGRVRCPIDGSTHKKIPPAPHAQAHGAPSISALIARGALIVVQDGNGYPIARNSAKADDRLTTQCAKGRH